jgi:Pirin C-terminal cupin domain
VPRLTGCGDRWFGAAALSLKMPRRHVPGAREFGWEPADARSRLDALLIAGLPLREPVVRYGPFVMNTKEEIVQAVEDFRGGRLGPRA